MVAEQRRAVAGISRHDVQQNLPRGESRAGDRGEQRHGIVAGARPEADVENRPYRQHRELDALDEAQRTGKLVEQELCRKSDRKNQRNGVKAERIEGQGERSSHGALRSWGALRTTASARRWRGADRWRWRRGAWQRTVLGPAFACPTRQRPSRR